MSACARTDVPSVPAGAPVALAHRLVPHAFHFVPYTDFRGVPDGAQPVAGLVADSKGDYFGVATAGGASHRCVANAQFSAGCGVVFELVRSTSGYTKRIVHSFHGGNGARPRGALTSNGGTLAFGTTALGGAYGLGTVFQVDLTTGAVAVLYSFKGGSDGASPMGSLYVDTQGNVFGATALGGGGGKCPGGCGTVFELAASSGTYTESVMYAFRGGNDGWEPVSGVLGSNGQLFGTTLLGGDGNCQRGCGTIFRIDVAHGSVEHLIHALNGANEGAYITSPLYLDASGNIYVEAANGGNPSCTGSGAVSGATGCGVVVELVQHGSGNYGATIVHTFSGADGAEPSGGIAASNGALYGTTAHGGTTCTSAGCGLAFSLSASGTYAIVHEFSPAAKGGARGISFFSTATGGLDGASLYGGKYGYGSIFAVN